jgi:zinc transport system permease protein
VCGFLGIYVVLHRIVFVSAAMSEVSSLGVMIAFLLAQMEAVDTSQHTEDVLPLTFAAIFTGLFAAAMAKHTTERIADRSKSSEALIGSVYLLSAAGLLLVGDRVTRGAHDISNVLFGNAVVVDGVHLGLLVAIGVPVLLLHIWLRKDVVFISFDPAMARTLGYPVTALRLFLLVSLGMVISIGTRTIGALPVFSFSVLPPIAALMLTGDLKRSFWVSALLGVAMASLGYLASFLFSFPTGACMTAMGGVILILARLARASTKT